MNGFTVIDGFLSMLAEDFMSAEMHPIQATPIHRGRLRRIAAVALLSMISRSDRWEVKSMGSVLASFSVATLPAAIAEPRSTIVQSPRLHRAAPPKPSRFRSVRELRLKTACIASMRFWIREPIDRDWKGTACVRISSPRRWPRPPTKERACSRWFTWSWT